MLDAQTEYLLQLGQFAQATRSWALQAQQLGELAARRGEACGHPAELAVLQDAVAQLRTLAGRYPGYRELLQLALEAKS